MPTGPSKNGYIYSGDWPLPTGRNIRFVAHNIRRERTGIHARMGVLLGNEAVNWSVFNYERHEDRTRFINAAHKAIPEIERAAVPAQLLQQQFDIWCLGLWEQHLDQFAVEELSGDVNRAVRHILYPYIIEGGGTIMFSLPGRGKSWTGMLMGVSIDAGVNPIWEVEQAKVLYVNLERSRQSMEARLAHVNGVLGLPVERRLSFFNARGMSLADIEDSVARAVESRGYGVVILDSISRSGQGKMTDDDVGDKVIDSLNRVSPTWLAIGHTPRADDSHQFGSVMFEAGEDIGVRLLSQRKQSPGIDTLGIGLKIEKVNDFSPPPMQVIALDFVGDILYKVRKADVSEFPLLAGGNKPEPADAIYEYLDRVGHSTVTDMKKSIGLSKPTIYAVLKSDPRFTCAGKQGRDVFYGIKTTRAP